MGRVAVASSRSYRARRGTRAFLSRSWGMLLYIMVVLLFFVQLSYRQGQEERQLRARTAELIAQKAALLQVTQRLHEQVRYQTSQEWIEQRMIGRLGLVPRGMRKVVFLQQDRAPTR